MKRVHERIGEKKEAEKSRQRIGGKKKKKGYE